MVLHNPAWASLLERRRGREAIADILTRFLNGDVQEGIAQAPDISPGAHRFEPKEWPYYQSSTMSKKLSTSSVRPS